MISNYVGKGLCHTHHAGLNKKTRKIVLEVLHTPEPAVLAGDTGLQ